MLMNTMKRRRSLISSNLIRIRKRDKGIRERENLRYIIHVIMLLSSYKKTIHLNAQCTKQSHKTQKATFLLISKASATAKLLSRHSWQDGRSIMQEDSCSYRNRHLWDCRVPRHARNQVLQEPRGYHPGYPQESTYFQHGFIQQFPCAQSQVRSNSEEEASKQTLLTSLCTLVESLTTEGQSFLLG